jgi:hypothetical protein
MHDAFWIRLSISPNLLRSSISYNQNPAKPIPGIGDTIAPGQSRSLSATQGSIFLVHALSSCWAAAITDSVAHPDDARLRWRPVASVKAGRAGRRQ